MVAASAAATYGIGSAFSSITNTAAMGFWAGAAYGAKVGAASGFFSSAVSSWISGESFIQGIKSGVKGALIGGALGGGYRGNLWRLGCYEKWKGILVWQRME